MIPIIWYAVEVYLTSLLILLETTIDWQFNTTPTQSSTHYVNIKLYLDNVMLILSAEIHEFILNRKNVIDLLIYNRILTICRGGVRDSR